MFQLYHGEKKLYFDERMMMMMGGSMSQVVGLPINSYKSYHQFLVVEEARVSGENHRPWASNG
jgi:hypothetical protein